MGRGGWCRPVGPPGLLKSPPTDGFARKRGCRAGRGKAPPIRQNVCAAPPPHAQTVNLTPLEHIVFATGIVGQAAAAVCRPSRARDVGELLRLVADGLAGLTVENSAEPECWDPWAGAAGQ